MYLFVKSVDCLDVFPENTANCFKIPLPDRLSYLSYSKCCVAGLVLSQFVKTDVQEVFLFSNFVSESVAGGSKLPAMLKYAQSPGK